jgi:transposase-like protein
MFVSSTIIHFMRGFAGSCRPFPGSRFPRCGVFATSGRLGCCTVVNSSISTVAQHGTAHSKMNYDDCAAPSARRKCRMCDKTFTRLAHLQRHEAINHSSAVNRWKCEYCTKSYTRRSDPPASLPAACSLSMLTFGPQRRAEQTLVPLSVRAFRCSR